MNAIEEGLEILECAIEELEAVAANPRSTKREAEAAVTALLRRMTLVNMGVTAANGITKSAKAGR